MTQSSANHFDQFNSVICDRYGLRVTWSWHWDLNLRPPHSRTELIQGDAKPVYDLHEVFQLNKDGVHAEKKKYIDIEDNAPN